MLEFHQPNRVLTPKTLIKTLVIMLSKDQIHKVITFKKCLLLKILHNKTFNNLINILISTQIMVGRFHKEAKPAKELIKKESHLPLTTMFLTRVILATIAIKNLVPKMNKPI